MKIGRLFLGIRRTSEMASRNYTIAVWAYETGYWRWAVWWSPPTSWRNLFRIPRIRPSMNSGRCWRVGGHVSFWWVVPILGNFQFSTQPRMDSMKYYRHK